MQQYLPREQLIENMRSCLNEACTPVQLTIVDDSQQHVGHVSHQGAGHFTVTVVSPVFANQSLIKRHQLVYHALKDYMIKEIHALRIVAKTPDEA